MGVCERWLRKTTVSYRIDIPTQSVHPVGISVFHGGSPWAIICRPASSIVIIREGKDEVVVDEPFCPSETHEMRVR